MLNLGAARCRLTRQTSRLSRGERSAVGHGAQSQTRPWSGQSCAQGLLRRRKPSHGYNSFLPRYLGGVNGPSSGLFLTGPSNTGGGSGLAAQGQSGQTRADPARDTRSAPPRAGGDARCRFLRGTLRAGARAPGPCRPQPGGGGAGLPRWRRAAVPLRTDTGPGAGAPPGGGGRRRAGAPTWRGGGGGR